MSNEKTNEVLPRRLAFFVLKYFLIVVSFVPSFVAIQLLALQNGFRVHFELSMAIVPLLISLFYITHNLALVFSPYFLLGEAILTALVATKISVGGTSKFLLISAAIFGVGAAIQLFKNWRANDSL